MKRAGLDYHEFAKLTVHENFEDCLKALEGRRIFALTTKGSTRPDEVSFREGDVLLFGPKHAACLPKFSTACLPDKNPPADDARQQEYESFQYRRRHSV